MSLQNFWVAHFLSRKSGHRSQNSVRNVLSVFTQHAPDDCPFCCLSHDLSPGIVFVGRAEAFACEISAERVCRETDLLLRLSKGERVACWQTVTTVKFVCDFRKKKDLRPEMRLLQWAEPSASAALPLRTLAAHNKSSHNATAVLFKSRFMSEEERQCLPSWFQVQQCDCANMLQTQCGCPSIVNPSCDCGTLQQQYSSCGCGALSYQVSCNQCQQQSQPQVHRSQDKRS